MCKRFTMLTWDETMSVVRSLEAHAPLNPVPDWPARRIDAFPDAEVSVIVGGGSRTELPRLPISLRQRPPSFGPGPHAATATCVAFVRHAQRAAPALGLSDALRRKARLQHAPRTRALFSPLERLV